MSVLNLVQAQNRQHVAFHDATGLVESAEYSQANKAFLAIMHPDSTLPDALCYFFGKSLYHTGYVEQSTQLLQKYLDLTDSLGDHYDSTMAYMRLIKGDDFDRPAAKESSANLMEHQDHHNTQLNDAPCNGNEFVVCPVCNGSGVIVTVGKFGNFYKACPYSDEHGRMPCRNYLEYLNGNMITIGDD